MIAHLVGILAVAMEPQAHLIGHAILRWKIQLVNRDHSCAVLFDSLKNKATSAWTTQGNEYGSNELQQGCGIGS